MTADEARKVLLDHPLPTAGQRTNVRTKDCTPQGRWLAHIRPEEKAYRKPLTGFPCLLQLSCAWLQLEEAFLLMKASYPPRLTVPSHCLSTKTKTTMVTSGSLPWETMKEVACGLRALAPVALYSPPHPTEPWYHNLRGDYHDLHNTWVKFSPRCYHAFEEVASGRRVSLSLSSPRSRSRISPHALSELQNAGFYPPRSIQHICYPPFCEEQAMNGEDAQKVLWVGPRWAILR